MSTIPKPEPRDPAFIPGSANAYRALIALRSLERYRGALLSISVAHPVLPGFPALPDRDQILDGYIRLLRDADPPGDAEEKLALLELAMVVVADSAIARTFNHGYAFDLSNDAELLYLFDRLADALKNAAEVEEGAAS
jgi:hypothetical protein